MALTYADIKKWGLARLSDVAGGVSGVASFNTRTGAVTAVTADLSDSSAAGRALVTAADAAAQRTALGLGTAATTASSAYATAAQGAAADTALQPGSVVNSLTSTSTTAPLSAAQGKVLKDAADLKLVAGAQLTQAAVTAATAAGVAMLDAANAAAQAALIGAATQYDPLSTVASSGASSSASVASAGVLDITLTGNCSISLSGAVSGQSWGITMILRQDATGSRTVSWPSGTKWAAGAAPTLSTAANSIDIVSLFSVNGGTTWFGALCGKAFA